MAFTERGKERPGSERANSVGMWSRSEMRAEIWGGRINTIGIKRQNKKKTSAGATEPDMRGQDKTGEK